MHHEIVISIYRFHPYAYNYCDGPYLMVRRIACIPILAMSTYNFIEKHIYKSSLHWFNRQHGDTELKY